MEYIQGEKASIGMDKGLSTAETERDNEWNEGKKKRHPWAWVKAWVWLDTSKNE